jgi:hypothetical protein
VRDKKTGELVEAVEVSTFKPVVSIDIPVRKKTKDEVETDRVYIEQLKKSLPLHGPRFFFGVYENKPVYEASFKKTYEGCFKVDGTLSAFVEAFRTPTTTFCEPPGTIRKFHAVREGKYEPEIAVWTMYENQKTEMWFRSSKFRAYGEVSFREVGREKTLSPEMLQTIENGKALLAVLLLGILITLVVAYGGGAGSSAGAGASWGGSGSRTWVGSGTTGQVGSFTRITSVQKETGLGASDKVSIKWEGLWTSHNATGQIRETDSQGNVTSFQMGDRRFEWDSWSGWKEKE